MTLPGYLTIDVGSSGVRATLFDADLGQLNSAQRVQSLLATGAHAELDLDPLWQTVIEVVRDIVAPHVAIGAIGITAQLGIVVVDARGEPLRPAILWPDHRAEKEAGELLQVYGDEHLYRSSGRRVDAELPAPKLLWLQRHEPDVWRRVCAVLSLKDYLVHRFTGATATDPAHASYSLLFDVGEGKWHEGLTRDLGLQAAAVPVLPGYALAGNVTASTADVTGILSGTPVIVGGPDGSVGALGAGLVDPGAAVDISGTTDVFFALVARPVFDPNRRVVLNASLLPDLWAVGGPSGMTGGMLQWFAEEIAASAATGDDVEGADVYFRLIEEAAAVAPGCNGLVTLPTMTGGRAPTWDRFRRGAIVGLSPAHRRAHIARAILEGSAFVLADLVDAVTALGVPVEKIRVAGGGAQSQLWAQIKANVCDRPFLMVRQTAASSLGAAMLAAVATGRFENVSAAAKIVAIDQEVTPAPRDAAIYRRLRPLARAIGDHLAADFAALAAEPELDNWPAVGPGEDFRQDA